MRITNRGAIAMRLLAGAAFVFAASAANAQTAPAQPADQAQASDSRDDDIIVTAQKRAENVQDVPQAVQVVSGAQLEARGIRDFTDLTKVAPSLIVRPSDQPVNASISIRGIGTFAFSIGVEPSVAVQVDDVPVTFQARAFADLSDVERIEVLRGPQSTLYGKSASAGLINIVTLAPTKEWTGKVNALATTDREYTIGGTIAGPLSDTLGVRVSVNHDDFRGNVHNLFNDEWVNGRRFTSAKGKLVWDPVSNVTATVGLNYIDGSTSFGRPYIRGFGATAYLRGNVAQPLSVYAPGVVVGPENQDISNNAPAGTNYNGFGQSLKLEVDVGGPTLVSVTSHDRYTLDDFLDQDDTSVTTPDNRQGGRFKSRAWTQEVRLVSPSDQPFRYTLGAYYADVTYSRRFTRGPAFSQANWYGTSGSTQAAAFGQLDWEFLTDTTATGGLRYQHEKVNYTFLDYQNGNAFFSGNATDDFVTYRLGLQHKFTEDVMLYGSYSTGHKGQTYDLTTGFNAQRASGGPVQPETSRSWEAGLRTQFLDHRLTMNLTAFTANYRNFQAQGIETFPDGTVNYRLANVGTIRSRGVEFELAGRVGEDLRLGGSAAYLDARITSFPFAQCWPGQTAAQGCTGSPTFQNLAGARPAQSPEWKLAANLDYSPTLGSLPFKGLFQAAYSYQSAMNFSLSQDPETIHKAFGIMNLAIGIRSPDGKYEVAAFVNNAFDVQYYANLINSRGTYNNVQATQAQLPRDFRRYAGLRASFSF
ncbi:MAG: TonB-dependent receptor [Sphingomonas bacterium]|uniref:TonB-dependent receptor n=1 Tax=Sphingomonas bacterium TaxID=1895847 RepID=UPI0026077806|nr:TonB-dependent receptor [Sphingomonas bacterium]MDB5707888.1 TonB-dependent receptor [Sphingomonas bacterium]